MEGINLNKVWEDSVNDVRREMNQIKLSESEALSDPVQAIVRLLELSVIKIWSSVLTGNQCENVRKTYEDMGNPQPGDLVIEMSTVYRRTMQDKSPRSICGIGYLESVTFEPYCSIEKWREDGNEDDVPKERVFNLTLLDGRKFRWVNAMFLKVPIE